LFDLGREVNTLLNSGQPVSRGTLQDIDNLYSELGGTVLGIIPGELVRQADSDLVGGLVRLLIDLRQKARQSHDWEQADAIRDQLAARGVVLEDGAEGTRWRLSR
ncbi:MAG: CysS/YqeB C-terminal domain-containing protein, partial [Anaerolineae bacterium]